MRQDKLGNWKSELQMASPGTRDHDIRKILKRRKATKDLKAQRKHQRKVAA